MTHKHPKRALALLSSLVLGATFLTPAAFAEVNEKPAVNNQAQGGTSTGYHQEKILKQLKEMGRFTEASSESVRVLVTFKAQPRTPSEANEKNFLQRQTQKLVDWEKQYGFKVDRQFGYLFNGVSGSMPENKMVDLASDPLVASVKKERVYYQSEHNAAKEHQSPLALENYGVDGTGTVIAVIDSGVDPAHPDLRLDSCEDAKIRDINPAGLFTCKVPNGYNYADKSFEIRDLTPSQHGQHVAGIAAANGSEGKTSEFSQTGRIDGAAPNAQILAMKVFSNNPSAAGGAMDGDIIAAIEDSVKLGADVINMSLGSDNGLKDDSDGTSFAIKAARDQGVITLVAAGNAGQNYSLSGGPDDVLGLFDDGIVGWPSTQEGAFSVASIDNPVSTFPLAFFGNEENATEFGYQPHTGKADDTFHELVYVNLGRATDYQEGQNLNGAYALIQRGEISFQEKFQLAIDHGAAGVIVFNNQPGNDAPGMAGVDGFEIFGVSIGNDDGQAILKALQADPSVKVKFTERVGSKANPDSLTPSDFTSWGTTSALEFSPEIAGIGGGVYSTVGSDSYATMSGTSMATPNLSGLSALLVEAYGEKYPEITGAQRVDLIKTTLMNTALIPEVDGVPFAPRQIGAGLAQVNNALSTDVILTSNSKPYIELKEVNEARTITVTLKNLGTAEAKYTIPTQRVLTESNNAGERTTTSFSSDTLSTNQQAVTVPAKGEVEVSFTLTPDTKAPHFTEGYIVFEGEADTQDLSIPYLGFVGDWNAEEIIKNPGEAWLEGQTVDTTRLATSTLFGPIPLEDEEVGTLAVSPNSDGFFDTVIPQMLMMRNAEAVDYEILDKENNSLITIGRDENVRRVSAVDVATAEFPGQTLTTGRNFDGFLWDTKAGIFNYIPDGEYKFRIKSRLSDEWDWQVDELDFKVDTVEPTITVIEQTDELVKFQVADDNAGIFLKPGAYGPKGEEMEVEQIDDSTYQVKLNADFDFFSIEVADKGFNFAEHFVFKAPGYISAVVAGHEATDGSEVWVSSEHIFEGNIFVGGVASPDVTEVHVNGEPAVLENGFYKIEHLIGSATSKYPIKIEAYSGSELVKKYDFTVSVDSTYPTLELDEGIVVDGMVKENNAVVHLSGRVSDDRPDAPLSLMVNDTEVELAADGRFSIDYQLRENESAVVLAFSDGLHIDGLLLPVEGRAISHEGQTVFAEIVSPYCAEPFGLCFVGGSDNYDRETGMLNISGFHAENVTRVELFTDARATENGYSEPEQIPVEMGEEFSFSAKVKVKTGINNLRLVAYAGDQVLTDRGYSIFVDVEPPKIVFDSPMLKGGALFTNQDEVMFSGTIYDDGWGHYLSINNNWVTDFWRFNNYGQEVNEQKFEHLLKVENGDTIFIYSKDTMDNSLLSYILVVKDKEEPTIGFEGANPGELIKDRRTINAFAEDPWLAQTRVTLNGEVIYDQASEMVVGPYKVEDTLMPPTDSLPEDDIDESLAGVGSIGAKPNIVSTANSAADESEDSEDPQDPEAIITDDLVEPDTSPETGVIEGSMPEVINTKLGVDIDTSKLPAGQYTIGVEALDLAGNVKTQSLTVVVDAEAIIEGPDTLTLEVGDSEIADQKQLIQRLLAQYKVIDDGSVAGGETKLSVAEGTVLVPGSQKVLLVATAGDGTEVGKVIDLTIKLIKPQQPGKGDSDDSAPGKTPGKPGATTDKPNNFTKGKKPKRLRKSIANTGANNDLLLGAGILVLIAGAGTLVAKRRR